MKHERDLTSKQRAELDAAHNELDQATRENEAFLSITPLQPDAPTSMTSATAALATQERLQAAYDKLWELREKYLDWKRP